MTEFMVPRTPEVTERLEGFFGELGWQVRPDTDEPPFVYVQPIPGDTPTFGYWHTENAGKIARFEDHQSDQPSAFARGLRLPELNDLVEVCLIVPTDEDTNKLWDQGGKLLRAHAHIPLRPHAGADEFRFSDPFNYSIRITANPGYQLRSSK